MADRHVFHIRRDLLAFVLVVLTAAGGVFVYYHALPCRYVVHHARADAAILAALAVIAVDVLLLVLGTRVVVVDEEGLRFGSVFRVPKGAPSVPWAQVRDVAFPRSQLLGPYLILVVDPPLPGRWWRRGRSRVHLGVYWAEHTRLFNLVLERATGAWHSGAVHAYLAAPHRLRRRYKWGLALAMAFATCVFAHGLYEALACGVIGFASMLLLTAAMMPCPFFAAAAAREWVWKTALVAVEVALIALTLHGVVTAFWVFGINGPLVVLLSLGLAWSAVTTLVCVARRPRAWRVAAAYGAAVAAAVVPAWLAGVREPIPAREGPAMAIGLGEVRWSPDGSAVWSVTRGLAGQKGAVHVLDVATLRARSVPSGGRAASFQGARHYDFLSLTRREPADGRAGFDELVALNTTTGRSTSLFQAPHIQLAGAGDTSSGGLMRVFLAGEADSLALHTLRTGDLSVGEVSCGRRFSRFTEARWRADGSILLAEHRRDADETETLSLWSFAPGGPPPKQLYRTTDRSVTVDYSPDLQWAAVGIDSWPSSGARWKSLGLFQGFAEFGMDWDTVDRCELVDLATGRRRALARPLPRRSLPLSYRLVAWSPDSKLLAYTALEADAYVLVCIEPATGAVRRPYRTRSGRMTRVALSSDARYAACLVRRGLGSRLRIVELATGRARTIRRVLMFPFFHQIAWSPVRPTLAVAFPKDTRPHSPRLVRLYGLE